MEHGGIAAGGGTAEHAAVLAYENKRWRLSADSEVCRRLDGFLYGAIVGNLNRRVDFETLSKEFTVRGIAHMPVKGYYLRKLYPVPELRTFGDIDLLIHREDRQKVHELMLSLGYSVKQTGSRLIPTLKVRNIMKSTRI